MSTWWWAALVVAAAGAGALALLDRQLRREWRAVRAATAAMRVARRRAAGPERPPTGPEGGLPTNGG